VSRDIKVGPYKFGGASNMRAGHARAALYAHVIEGKLVSTAQIARRVGISYAAAAERAKRGPFPLTWSNLSQFRLTQSTKEQQQ
jgi:hypothetical protein